MGLRCDSAPSLISLTICAQLLIYHTHVSRQTGDLRTFEFFLDNEVFTAFLSARLIPKSHTITNLLIRSDYSLPLSMQNLGILFILTNLVSVTAFMSGITLIADYACLISSSSSEKHEVRRLNPSVDALHFLDMDHFRTLTPCDDFDSTLDSILSHSPDTDAELVNWVDCENNKIKTLTRSMIHKYNILHSGAGILPVNGQQIYCHQVRSASIRPHLVQY